MSSTDRYAARYNKGLTLEELQEQTDKGEKHRVRTWVAMIPMVRS